VRHLLTTAPAPATGLVSIVTLSATMNNSMALALSYVPDKLILTRTGFDAYAAARNAAPLTTPEAIAADIAADVANELVPRWLRVTVNSHSGGAINHSVTVEDRQPGWDHLSLLKNV
jgi:NADPH-dependent 7-cyano-7-deazaguanine reductase QueF